MTVASRIQPSLHSSLVRKFRHSTSISAAVASPPKEGRSYLLDASPGKVRHWSSVSGGGDGKGSEGWKKFDAELLGISNSMIEKPTQEILNKLKKKGYEVYLVGGCVRDLILKRTPKDFDIVTSAELKQVQKTFRRCQIVGKKFPICHVHVGEKVVEVSSFSTSAKKAGGTFNHGLRKPPGCSGPDYMRWRNCLQRDFTINGIMFDPHAKIVYDYLGGIQDIRKTKVRTVAPADLSFAEDCARILRAIRIAARLGFHFTKEIALSLKLLSHKVLGLDKGRILMEVNYMLAYGSAEASLRLLWRFGILEILLPIQASYFVSQGFRRRDGRSNLLLSLFSNLDRLVAPNRPCNPSLWVGILAFHKALVDEPQDPAVVAAFSLTVLSGGSLSNSAKIARSISQPHTHFLELLEPKDLGSNYTLMNQVLSFAASVRASLFKMTDGHYISQAMAKYPQAPHSNLVFISTVLSARVEKIFECVRRGLERGSVPKRAKKIDHECLEAGNLQEVRHAFARIVFDTVYPLKQNNGSKFVNGSNS